MNYLVITKNVNHHEIQQLRTSAITNQFSQLLLHQELKRLGGEFLAQAPESLGTVAIWRATLLQTWLLSLAHSSGLRLRFTSTGGHLPVTVGVFMAWRWAFFQGMLFKRPKCGTWDAAYACLGKHTLLPLLYICWSHTWTLTGCKRRLPKTTNIRSWRSLEAILEYGS